jgi:hypothetical protein
MINKMHSIVNTLQKEPIETRKTILVVGSFGVTALIVVIWLTTFAFSHTQPIAQDQTGGVEKPTQSPFAIIKDNVVELYANASKGYNAASQK